jgi:hypothetical protein
MVRKKGAQNTAHIRVIERILTTSLLCAALSAPLYNTANASIFDALKSKLEEKAPSQTFASLSGFEPNATVTYRIHNPHGSAFSGMAQTDEFGNLTLPMPKEFQNNSSEVTYNFIVDEKNKSLNLILLQNAQTGELSIEGSGTQEFTKITIESQEKTVETQSDWAGLFEENKIKNILLKDKNAPYKIAFFSTDPARSIEELTRTPIIEIQSATGGGGPTNSGVNDYNATNCQSPQISFCDSGKMNGQIQNILDNFVEPMQLMAEQFTYNAMKQAFVIGTFFDAKEQLEAQRDIQALRAEAHRDYHPSEQLCRYGSFVKSLANTEQKMEADKLAINTILTDHYTNKKYTNSSVGESVASPTRLQQFRTTYCDVSDNNANLNFLCDHDQNIISIDAGADDQQRINKDIDFLRTYDSKYTLDMNFTDDTETEDEEDVIALAKNLYWTKTYQLAGSKYQESYLDARRIIALTNVAHNSFANQLAMKAQAPEVPSGQTAKNTGWAHIKTMMREFGLSDDDIVAVMGEKPSYYAQMDALTKKIYQSPNFYTNLYDSTTNIDRINATLDAISLMQQRDHYKTMLRQEMLTSSMLQTELTPEINRVNEQLRNR